MTPAMRDSQPPFFLVTARGGHSADPAARCPHCGRPAGVHRGFDLAGGKFFPMRAVICAPDCETCGDARWLGPGYRQPCPACNAKGVP